METKRSGELEKGETGEGGRGYIAGAEKSLSSKMIIYVK